MGAIIVFVVIAGFVVSMYCLFFGDTDSKEVCARRPRGRRKTDIASEMEEVSRAFYGFLAQLNRNPRCREELRALPGMDGLPKSGFSIIERQAARLASVAPLTIDMLQELTLRDLGFEKEDAPEDNP